MNSEKNFGVSNQNPDPFAEIRRTLRAITVVGAVFMSIVAIIAISGISVAWIALAHQVRDNQQRLQDNQELILSVCRMNNEQNIDIIVTALDLGVPPSKLTAFNPIDCTIKNIEKRFGHE